MNLKRSPIKKKKPKTRPWQTVKLFWGGREVTAGAEYMKRRDAMAVRQRGICAICLKPMGEDVTFDHETPRGNGGAFRDDRILDRHGEWQNAAVHFLCNYKKGSKRYMWLNGAYIPCK